MRKPKKNLHKIPNHVRDRLPLLSGDKVIAACVRVISQSSIEKGEFGHLGIEIETGALRFTERLVPIAAIGKYSRWNVNGADVAIRVQLNRTDYDKLVDRYQTINRWIEREGSPLKGTNAVRRAYTRSASSRRVP